MSSRCLVNFQVLSNGETERYDLRTAHPFRSSCQGTRTQAVAVISTVVGFGTAHRHSVSAKLGMGSYCPPDDRSTTGVLCAPIWRLVAITSPPSSIPVALASAGSR